MADNRLDEVIAELKALRIQVAQLEAEVVRRGNDRAPTAADPVPVEQARTHDYAVGDRVRVLNKVRKPATWNNRVVWNEAAARQGTVTEVRPRQVLLLHHRQRNRNLEGAE